MPSKKEITVGSEAFVDDKVRGQPAAEAQANAGAPKEQEAELCPEIGMSHSLQGISGWLALFCFGTTILTPLFLVLEALSYSRQPFVVVIDLLVAGLAVYTGIALFCVKGNALRLLRIYFTVELSLAILTIFASFLSEPLATYHPNDALGTGARTLLMVIIWWSYFRKSKRVRATYGFNI